MIKNNKGSALIWAVMLVLILMVIVGASLTFSEVNYNQSVANKNQAQADLTADSAIKSVVALVETNQDNPLIIPSNVGDTCIISNIEFTNTTGIYGKVENIEIVKDSNNQITASLSVNYKDKKANRYAILILKNNTWIISKYSDEIVTSSIVGGDLQC